MTKVSLVLRAPAKLNLTLEVLNRRSDGYHNLRSVMVPIDLCDEIEVSRGAGALNFECTRPDLQADNLVVSALRVLQLPSSDLNVTLRKRIPVGAGLGGGSSDAAALLLAAMNGEFGPLEDRDYVRLARSLGSDVPFFLAGTAAIVEGTGERVTALGTAPHWFATVIKPPVSISTEQAYAALDARAEQTRPRNSSVTLRLGEALQRADFDLVNSLLSNDFAALVAARNPQVQTAMDALAAWSGRPAMLTGSGSCVFTLWKDAPPAEGLALPQEFERFDAAFARSTQWRPEA